MPLDDQLLDILVCPIDKGSLLYYAEDGTLYNPRLLRLYRVESDIPLMRADQAVPVTPERHRLLLAHAETGQARTTAGTPVEEILGQAQHPEP